MTAVKKSTKSQTTQSINGNNCLCDNVRDAMQAYFKDLDGQDVSGLYNLFLSEVEKPLFEVVMQNTGGNVTRAAHILGLNRATLRGRLKKHGLA